METESILVITYDDSISDRPCLMVSLVDGENIRILNTFFGNNAKELYDLLRNNK